jgi:hypothetical protein
VKNLLVQKILPVTIPVFRSLTVCLIVEPACTGCNIHDAEGKKWSVKQQEHGNCSSRKHKEEDGNHAEFSE